MVLPHSGPDPAAHARPQTWWDAEGNEHPCYVLRFWFEWATETALWPAKNVARERFGIGPIMPEELPLLEATQRQVRALATWHERALNWEYPPDPGPWRHEECDRFNSAVTALYATIVRELGDTFDVIHAQPEERENPDLDVYLQDPKGFKRA